MAVKSTRSRMSAILALTLLYAFFNVSSSRNTRANLSESLLDQIAKSDQEDTPPFDDNGTEVQVSFHLNSISSLRAANMDYWIDVLLSQRWVDQRLHENGSVDQFITLPKDSINKIWTPDVIFAKAKSGKMKPFIDPNTILKLNPSTGTLRLIQQVRAQVGCSLDFTYFPFDHQECEIVIESWRYNSDILKLRWSDASYEIIDNDDLDALLSESLPSLNVNTTYDTSYCEVNVANRGKFSCLRYGITFCRGLKYYILDIYIPSTLMVIVTWMSFWIERRVIQGRTTIGSFTMVAISNQINSVKSVLPPTTQTKAADVWLWACQFYVLLAFLEFGLVNWVSRRDLAKQRFLKAELEKLEQKTAITEEHAKMDKTTGGTPVMSSLTPPKAVFIEDCNGTVTQVDQFDTNNGNDGAAGNTGSAKVNLVQRSVELREEKTLLDRFRIGAIEIWKKFRNKDNSKKVDNISRGLFPFSFLIFSIVYWAYYLSKSGHYSCEQSS